MPVVTTSLQIPDVAIEHVWAVVCDFERHPEYMRDVLEVRYLERGQDTALSAWRIMLNGSELSWQERDVFTAPHRIDFDQIDGDLEVFRGSWVLTQVGSAVEVRLEIEFDIGIPSLTEVLDPLGIQAIQANSRSMLTAIAARRAEVTG